MAATTTAPPPSKTGLAGRNLRKPDSGSRLPRIFARLCACAGPRVACAEPIQVFISPG
jgi:hypothetical protein